MGKVLISSLVKLPEISDVLSHLSKLHQLPSNAKFLALIVASAPGCDSQFLSEVSGLSKDSIEKYQLQILDRTKIIRHENDKLFIRIPSAEELGKPQSTQPKPKEKTIREQVTELLTFYRNAWEKIYKGKCVTTARDREKAYELVTKIGFDDALSRLKNYMQSTEKWYRDKAHPFAVFTANSNTFCESARVGNAQSSSSIIEHNSPEFEKKIRSYEGRVAEKFSRGNASAQRARCAGKGDDL